MLPNRTETLTPPVTELSGRARIRSDYSCYTVCELALASFEQRPIAHAAITREQYGMHNLVVGCFVHFRYVGGCSPLAAHMHIYQLFCMVFAQLRGCRSMSCLLVFHGAPPRA